MIDRKLTIEAIRKLEGLTLPVTKNDSVPLSIWYHGILSSTLEQLSDGDVAKLIRQKRHLNFVLNEAIVRISNNPLAGELFDGELVSSINNVPQDYWKRNIEFLEVLLEILEKIKKSRSQTKLSFSDQVEEDEYFSMLEKTIKDLHEAAKNI